MSATAVCTNIKLTIATGCRTAAVLLPGYYYHTYSRQSFAAICVYMTAALHVHTSFCISIVVPVKRAQIRRHIQKTWQNPTPRIANTAVVSTSGASYSSSARVRVCFCEARSTLGSIFRGQLASSPDNSRPCNSKICSSSSSRVPFGGTEQHRAHGARRAGTVHSPTAGTALYC